MRAWSGFHTGTDAAILPLSDIMAIVSTPRHSARLSGNYVSSAPSFASPFFERLKEVTRGAAFWDPAAP